MILLDGKTTSQYYLQQMKLRVDERKSKGLSIPHLAAVIVGDNPASRTYVNSKVKHCQEVGFQSSLYELPETVTEDALLEVVYKLNNDNNVHGILVQLPLPKHIDENKIIMAINADKDVDGFHPINVGRMCIGLPGYKPATPYGIMLMLEHYKIDTAGKDCVVIGRSNIVGTPMSILMSRNTNPGNCTVTTVHSRTKNIADIILRADIIIAAIGKPKFVTADMVKDGAVVIDVGINRIEDTSKKSGFRLVGDVDFDNVAPKCSYITPVPGGVGLMTIAGLMMNTLQSVEMQKA